MQFWSSWLLKNCPQNFDANGFQKFPSLLLMQQSESTTGFFREKAVEYSLCSGEPPKSNRFLIVPTMGPRLWCKGIVMQSSSIRSPRNQISRPSKATFYHKSIAANLFLFSTIKLLLLVRISCHLLTRTCKRRMHFFVLNRPKW